VAPTWHCFNATPPCRRRRRRPHALSHARTLSTHARTHTRGLMDVRRRQCNAIYNPSPGPYRSLYYPTHGRSSTTRVQLSPPSVPLQTTAKFRSSYIYSARTRVPQVSSGSIGTLSVLAPVRLTGTRKYPRGRRDSPPESGRPLFAFEQACVRFRDGLIAVKSALTVNESSQRNSRPNDDYVFRCKPPYER